MLFTIVFVHIHVQVLDNEFLLKKTLPYLQKYTKSSKIKNKQAKLKMVVYQGNNQKGHTPHKFSGKTSHS